MATLCHSALSAMTKQSQSSLTEALFAGNGEMCALMKSHDWSQTRLGPIEQWPQSLRTTVSILLNSRYPMFIFWGPDLVKLYNDGYRPILGDKHPWALGRTGPEIWPEIWDTIGPMVDQVITNSEATWSDNLLLFMHRSGYPEEVYFTFSYSPVRDETGGVGGVFCACTETTQQVLSDRRLRTLRDLAARAGEAKNADEACKIAVQTLANNPADLPFALLYLLNGDGTEAYLAGTTGLAPGTLASPLNLNLLEPSLNQAWPLAEVAQTAQTTRIDDVIDRLGELDVGPWPEPPHMTLVLPVASPGQTRPIGLLVAGISPRRALNDDYQGFLELVSRQIASAIADACAYEAERQRAEALAEIDRAKTIFFSNISHEFRTPLTLMLAPIEDSLTDTAAPLPPTQRDRIEIAQRNSLRLLRLVNTLLDFSRIEAGRAEALYQPTDLATFTAELASTFRSLIEKAGLALVVDCPPLPQAIYVDRSMWEKIVLNLLSNAFKYTLAGQITVCLQSINNHVELSVHDTGTGIPPQDIPHLFERFHRVKGAQGRSFEGSGIGLSLVNELVKLHGGSIQVSSILGEGSCFTLSIPKGFAHLPGDHIAAPQAHQLQLSETAAPYNSQQVTAFVEEARRWLSDDIDYLPSWKASPQTTVLVKPRILLADDNADMRSYAKRLLEERYAVEAVADGAVALAAIQRCCPDLVLTDVMMPNLDGFGLLKALRADPNTRSLPVILLSARAGEESRIEGLEAGADDYLAKPFSAREMLARIEACLKLAQIRREAALQEQALRFQAEQAQQEAEATAKRLNHILESMTDAFVAIDQDWRIVYQNAAAEQVNGNIPRSQVLGKTLQQVWPAIIGTEIEQQYCQAITTQRPVHFEYHYVDLPAFDFWMEIHAYPFEGGLGIFFRDISERKQAEAERDRAELALKRYNEDLEARVVERTAALSQSLAELQQAQEALRIRETHYRQSLRLANTGSWEFEITTQKVFWSESMEAIWGVEHGTFKGEFEQVKANIHPQDFDIWLQNVENCIEHGAEHNLEFRVVHPDSSVHWVHAFGNAEYDDHGQAVCLRGLVLDITERKTAEEHLRLYQQIVSNSQDLMAFVDNTYTYRIVNDAYATRFNTTKEAIIGQPVVTIVGEEAFTQYIHPNLDRCFRGESVHYQFWFDFGNGQRYLDLLYSPYREATTTTIGAVVTIRDITSIYEAQVLLSLQARRAGALLKLPQISEQLDETGLIQYGQDLAKDLTHSLFAAMYVVDQSATDLDLMTGSYCLLMQACSMSNNGNAPSIHPQIWSITLHKQQPIVINTPADLSLQNLQADTDEQPLANQAEFVRCISVPVVENGKVVMLTGVMNKPTKYTDLDIETIQLISNEVWRIVQRQRMVSHLTASERRLREAQNAARIGSWELNLKTQKLIWTDEVFRIFELSPAQFSSSYEAFLEAVHPDDREQVDQAYSHSVTAHTPYAINHRLLMPDGRIKHVYERGETYYAPDGSPERSVGTIQDVTEQFLADEKLRQAAAVFKSTAEGVMITDLNAIILDVNPAFKDITGYTRDEVLGQNVRILQSGMHDKAFYQKMWHCLKTQGSWQGEIWNKRKDGSVYPELLTSNVVRDNQGQPTGYVGVFTDITKVKQTEERLNYLAHHDSLTNLPNRLLLNTRLEQSICQSTRQHTKLAVVFIDLDRFKNINDSMGHAIGDILLRQLAQRLRQALRANDTVARISGDEFVVVLEGVDSAQSAGVAVTKLMDVFKAPFILEQQTIHMTASLGISLFPDDGLDAAILVRNADTAMYQAKEEGRNTYRFYAEEMTAAAFEHVLFENALRSALKREEFHLVYQPQIDLNSGLWVGVEALLRWHHPELGIVSPAQFIPIAEQSGLIHDIGTWVLHQACYQMKVWLDKGLNFGRVAVNISAPQLHHENFIQVITGVLETSGLPADYLELEVTEGFIMQRPEERIEQLNVLRQLGIQIAIDDFGTGYSSLSYLKRLPIDKLKIDKSFVRDIPYDPNDMAISEAVIALGQALDMQIIAEGVENEEQATFLRDKGCHEAQGYFYSHPISPEAIETLLSL